MDGKRSWMEGRRAEREVLRKDARESSGAEVSIVEGGITEEECREEESRRKDCWEGWWWWAGVGSFINGADDAGWEGLLVGGEGKASIVRA